MRRNRCFSLSKDFARNRHFFLWKSWWQIDIFFFCRLVYTKTDHKKRKPKRTKKSERRQKKTIEKQNEKTLAKTTKSAKFQEKTHTTKATKSRGSKWLRSGPSEKCVPGSRYSAKMQNHLQEWLLWLSWEGTPIGIGTPIGMQRSGFESRLWHFIFSESLSLVSILRQKNHISNMTQKKNDYLSSVLNPTKKKWDFGRLLQTEKNDYFDVSKWSFLFCLANSHFFLSA